MQKLRLKETNLEIEHKESVTDTLNNQKPKPMGV